MLGFTSRVEAAKAMAMRDLTGAILGGGGGGGFHARDKKW
jgi:hypothetical protein